MPQPAPPSLHELMPCAIECDAFEKFLANAHVAPQTTSFIVVEVPAVPVCFPAQVLCPAGPVYCSEQWHTQDFAADPETYCNSYWICV